MMLSPVLQVREGHSEGQVCMTEQVMVKGSPSVAVLGASKVGFNGCAGRAKTKKLISHEEL